MSIELRKYRYGKFISYTGLCLYKPNTNWARHFQTVESAKEFLTAEGIDPGPI